MRTSGLMNQWAYENHARHRGFQRIAGVDEVGRGPLAGPVMAAAVILPANLQEMPELGIRDSKQLSPKKREALYDRIYEHALSVGLGIVDPVEIDRINILQAALTAMVMALNNLSPVPDYVLVDGGTRLPVDISQKTIAKGDRLSISVAAASIVAKVSRDRMMAGYALEYPEYDLCANKGYPTRAHKSAISVHGASPIHRLSFKGVCAVDARKTALSGEC